MGRPASFDTQAFETKIIHTLLYSPVKMSCREIFAACGYDYSNSAMRSCFYRLTQKKHFKTLIDSDGDKKHRVYISKNPPKPVNRTEPVVGPKRLEGDKPPLSPVEKVPVHRPLSPEPTFEVQTVEAFADVIPALRALSEASGTKGLVGFGIDARQMERPYSWRRWHYPYDLPPCRELLLSAGELVCVFDVPKILSSTIGTSDENRDVYAPFRDFFANQTTVCHNATEAFAPLIKLDVLPLRLLETRLAIRMLHYEAGILGDDSLKSNILQHLHLSYKAKEALVATLPPLLNVLRSRLGAARETFESYCEMLPSLATMRARGLILKDFAQTPAYEVRGDGTISITPLPSELTESAKHSTSNGSTLVTVRFAKNPQMYQLLPALFDAHLRPVALLSDELVFNADDRMPEGTAIEVMRIIFEVIDISESIYLCRGFGWGASNWSYPSDGYRTLPSHWDDNWWDAWVCRSDVQSVLTS